MPRLSGEDRESAADWQSAWTVRTWDYSSRNRTGPPPEPKPRTPQGTLPATRRSSTKPGPPYPPPPPAAPHSSDSPPPRRPPPDQPPAVSAPPQKCHVLRRNHL